MNITRFRRFVFGAFLFLGVAAGLPAIGESGGGDGMAAMTATVRSKFPGVPQLRTAELAAWLQKKKALAPQLLDVREPREFEVSHLHAAINVRPDASAAEIMKKIDRPRPVVVYCSVGYRSSRLAERLIAAGLKNVSNLEGSIFAWANEGRALEKDGQPARSVDPYNAHYGRLLKPGYHPK